MGGDRMVCVCERDGMVCVRERWEGGGFLLSGSR